jgi:hypothetical protein
MFPDIKSDLSVKESHQLLEFINDPNSDLQFQDNHLIRCCSKYGHTDIVRILLKQYPNRVDPTSCDNYCIRNASAQGHVEIVKLLLSDERVDLSNDQNECLTQACIHANVEVLKLLLDHPKNTTNFPDDDIVIYAVCGDQYRKGYVEFPRGILTYTRTGATQQEYLDVIHLLCRHRKVDKDIGLRRAINCKEIHVVEYLLWEIMKETLFILDQVILHNHDTARLPKSIIAKIKFLILTMKVAR